MTTVQAAIILGALLGVVIGYFIGYVRGHRDGEFKAQMEINAKKAELDHLIKKADGN